VPGGSAIVSLVNCTRGRVRVRRAQCSDSPCKPGSSYYLVSQGADGGDQWYDSGPIPAPRECGGDQLGLLQWRQLDFVDGVNTSFVPPSFQYTVEPPPSPLLSSIST